MSRSPDLDLFVIRRSQTTERRAAALALREGQNTIHPTVVRGPVLRDPSTPIVVRGPVPRDRSLILAILQILAILLQTPERLARDRPSRYGSVAESLARDRPSRYGCRGVFFVVRGPSRLYQRDAGFPASPTLPPQSPPIPTNPPKIFFI